MPNRSTFCNKVPIGCGVSRKSAVLALSVISLVLVAEYWTDCSIILDVYSELPVRIQCGHTTAPAPGDNLNITDTDLLSIVQSAAKQSSPEAVQLLSRLAKSLSSSLPTESGRVYVPVRQLWLLSNADACETANVGGDFKALMLVSSRTGNEQLRDVIRQTWKPRLEAIGVKVLFFMAAPAGWRLLHSVVKESARHRDVVVHPYKDTYRSLVFASLAMLEWTATFCTPYRFGFRFLVKADDDQWINAVPYARFLHQEENLTRSIIGYQHNDVAVIREVNSPWYVSRAEYEPQNWPSYMSGGHYLLTADLIAPLLAVGSEIRTVPVEDIFLTGILASSPSVNATLINAASRINAVRSKPAGNWTDPSFNWLRYLVVHKVSASDFVVANKRYLARFERN